MGQKIILGSGNIGIREETDEATNNRTASLRGKDGGSGVEANNGFLCKERLTTRERKPTGGRKNKKEVDHGPPSGIVVLRKGSL